MPKEVSDHLFQLVKSLSTGEWNEFWRLYKADRTQRRSNAQEDSDAIVLVRAMTDSPEFDEQRFREVFIKRGTQPEKDRYLHAKADLERRILEAIQSTPENETEIFRLEKLPNLLLHLENRGIEYRIKKLLAKFLPLAEKLEMFDVQFKLLQYRIKYIERNELPEKRAMIVGQIGNEIKEIHQKQAELYALYGKRHELRAIFDHPGEERDGLIQSFDGDWNTDREVSSTRALIIQLEVNRRLYLHRRDMQNYRATLYKITELKRKNPILFLEEHHFSIYLDAIKSNIFLQIHTHNFLEAKGQIKELEVKAGNSKKHQQLRVEQSILTLKLHLYQKELDRKGIEMNTKKAREWYQKHFKMIGGENHHVYARLASESLCISGNWSEASHWLGYLVGSRPNIVLPAYTLPSNLWSLVIRYETEDVELLESEYRRTKRFLKKYNDGNAYGGQLLKLFNEVLAKGKVDFESHLQKLFQLKNEGVSFQITNFYPFEEWLLSKSEKTSLLAQVEKGSKPSNVF